MITLSPGESRVLNVTMNPKPATLQGVVSASGLPVVGAIVSLNGYSATTIANGSFQILGIIPGTYSGTVTHPDYETVIF